MNDEDSKLIGTKKSLDYSICVEEGSWIILFID